MWINWLINRVLHPPYHVGTGIVSSIGFSSIGFILSIVTHHIAGNFRGVQFKFVVFANDRLTVKIKPSSIVQYIVTVGTSAHVSEN